MWLDLFFFGGFGWFAFVDLFAAFGVVEFGWTCGIGEASLMIWELLSLGRLTSPEEHL